MGSPRARQGPVLIAGCGYLGGALAALLVGAGRRVWGLRRSGPLPAGVIPLHLDLARDPLTRVEGTLARAGCAAAATVVYAVGADRRDPESYRAAYTVGLESLLAALERIGSRPRRLVFLSSTGVYGRDDGAWVDEDTAPDPAGFAGRLLLEGEALARASGLPATVLRLGGLYGPGRSRWVRWVQEGGPPPGGGVSRYTNRIHRDDAARIVAWLLEAEACATLAPAPLYLAVDDEPATARQILEWLAGRGVARAREALASLPSGGCGLSRGKRCSNRRLRSAGAPLRYPTFREGLASLLGFPP